MTAAAILLLIIGGLTVLGALLFIGLGEFAGGLVVLGLLLLVVAGFMIWVGVALLQLRSWARTAGLIVSAVGALFAFITAFSDPASGIVDLVLTGTVFGLLASRAAQEADW